MRQKLGREMGFVCLLAATACGKPERVVEERHEPLACASDADCAGEDEDGPFCVAEECVQCLEDSHCSCNERCIDNNRCLALGATTVEGRYTAHGTWSGTPGTARYAFEGYCTDFNDCKAGEMCNPFTRGCVPAADFQEPCSSTLPCPAGPNGEVLACDATTGLCLPTARCMSAVNCCGAGEGFRCDGGAGVCMPLDTECTPPPEIVSSCPMEPRITDACNPGMFCTETGRCVQCGCDADCNPDSGLTRCYQATGMCVTEDYCASESECPDGQACEVQRNICVPRCETDDDCEEEYYCEPEVHVCRQNSARPCLPDAFEPNDTRDAATVNADRLLPVPEMGEATTVEGLSLCVGDEDWYGLDLVAGDRIIISTTTDTLWGNLEAYTPDGAISLGEGSIATVGDVPLDFTAQTDGIHFVVVSPYWAESKGYYNLEILRSQGEICTDPVEEEGALGPNNTIETAMALVGNNATLPEDCTLTHQDGATASTTVLCPTSTMLMCLGDVDYYSVAVPAGADLRVSLSEFLTNLDLNLYGPFSNEEMPTADRLADSSSSTWGDEEVGTTAREHSQYIIHVFNNENEASAYRLQVEIEAASAPCVEDAFDASAPIDGATSPALIQDPMGLNDQQSEASWLALTPDSTVTVQGEADELSLCRADVDWFRLGVDDGTGTLTDPPAGIGLVVTVQVLSQTGNDALWLRAGDTNSSTAEGIKSGPQTTVQATIRPTRGDAYYVQVAADANNGNAMHYTLSIAWESPGACFEDDGFGDQGETRNDTMQTATDLRQSPWPQAIGDRYGSTDINRDGMTLCAADEDWYALSVPEGAAVLAMVHADPNESNIGLSLEAGEATIAQSELPNSPYQRVLGDANGDAYLRVYNVGGWPQPAYDLEVEYVPAACHVDANEPNDTWQSATLIDMQHVPYERGVDLGVAKLGTFCSALGEDVYDWFRVELGPNDIITVRGFYDPDQGDIDSSLLQGTPESGDPTRVDSDTDDRWSTDGQDGILFLTHEATEQGDYYVRLRSFSSSSGATNIYYVEVMVQRGCLDDVFEATDPAVLPWEVSQIYESLVLCNDQDWYALDVPAAEAPDTARSVTVCAHFQHDVGDIDLEVYANDNGDAGSRVASSLSKADVERAVFTTAEGGRYYVRIFLDPRDSANMDYSLSVQDGDVPCP